MPTVVEEQFWLWIYVDPFVLGGGVVTTVIGVVGWYAKSWITYRFDIRRERFKIYMTRKTSDAAS